MKIFSLSSLFCTVSLFLLLSIPSPADTGMQALVPHQPVLHIPLRVHLGKSGRTPKKWLPIMEEINDIWLSQAGICFEMHAVTHDEELESGLDLWFESTIKDWNGYFTDLHDMHVRDNPELGPAEHPARSSAARTAAHELGHALKLPHRQDSDDNLMRSKTYGWQLNEDEIALARKAAAQLKTVTAKGLRCSIPAIHGDL